MRIMSFGHIPSWAGGRQESGLANVIYQLAKHESSFSDADVILAATDCFVPQRKDGNLTVRGWTRWGLIRYILWHPGKAVKSFISLRSLKGLYPLSERFLGLYLKRVFLDMTVCRVRPEVLHLHGANAIWYLDLVPEEVKVVVTFHGMVGLDKNVHQHEVLYHMEHDVYHSPRVCEAFFICTQLVSYFKNTYGDNGKRNAVILNSFDNTQFFLDQEFSTTLRNSETGGKGREETILCTVASLSDLKGQSRVLTGLATLPNHDSFKYLCIGRDNSGLSLKLNNYAREHGVSFQYLGKMKPDEIRRNLYSVDYMIMPSSSEGFGLTYLEAIACGVPVILPKSIPIAQERQLINEKNSILLDDCSPESIAKVLSHISEWHFNRLEVAATLNGFTWGEIAKQYLEAFKKL